MAQAINAVIAKGGGLSVVVDDGGAEVLHCPIAGLMSDADGYRVAAEYARLDPLTKSLGTALSSPFMTLSFMAHLLIRPWSSDRLGPSM